MQHSVSKIYRDFPAAHRQPNHDGHCRLIHGHDWGFDITFMCRDLDACGFVVDVGKLQKVKQFLTDTFDHTLLLNLDDPCKEALKALDATLANIRWVPNCGMEGLAKLVYQELNRMIYETGELSGSERGLVVSSVTVWEDSKNASTYLPE